MTVNTITEWATEFLCCPEAALLLLDMKCSHHLIGWTQDKFETVWIFFYIKTLLVISCQHINYKDVVSLSALPIHDKP